MYIHIRGRKGNAKENSESKENNAILRDQLYVLKDIADLSTISQVFVFPGFATVISARYNF